MLIAVTPVSLSNQKWGLLALSIALVLGVIPTAAALLGFVSTDWRTRLATSLAEPPFLGPNDRICIAGARLSLGDITPQR